MQINLTSYKFTLSIAITVTLLCFIEIASVSPGSLLQDPDTFWHIREGEWILENARVPTVDLYSYTAAGEPWISMEWLSEIFFAVAFTVGGWPAVVDLSALACAAIVGILCFYLVRHLRFSIAIGWTVLTVLAINGHFLARPHVFSYSIAIIWMIILLDAYDADDSGAPPVFALAPLMVLWANLHGSFTFGLALLYVFVGFGVYHNISRHDYTQCRRLLVVAMAVSLGALMTPYGIFSALMTVKLFELKDILHNIGEMGPPDFQADPLHLMFLVGTLSAMAGLGARLHGPRLVVFGMIVFLGLSSGRGLTMFFFLAPIILARPISSCDRYFLPQLPDKQPLDADKATDPVLLYLQKWPSAVPAVCMGVAMLVAISTWWRPEAVPAKFAAPEAAVDFVRRANITGNVFNDYAFGGFLIFSGIPTFVDGRAFPFGASFLRKYFDTVAIADSNSAFQILDDYNISWIILSPARPLAKAITHSAQWDKVYSDDYAVVFTRVRRVEGDGRSTTIKE